MKLSDNIWWTRKARIQTEKRLLSNSFQAQILLLWYSFFSVFAAIYHLNVATADALINVSWVSFSILTLTVSGFINGLSFKERAALVKECYETLNGLRIIAEIAEKGAGSVRTSDGLEESIFTNKTNRCSAESIKMIGKDFDQVLKVCENHTESDFRAALCEAHLTEPFHKLTKHPTKYTWLIFWLERLARIILFTIYVLLPVFIFFGMSLL